MKIVIVGDGKVGVTLTAQLSREGHDVVIIDNNPQVLRESVDQYDVLGILGNGASLQAQKEAGVESADLLIAATSADEVNLLCCILARKLGTPHTIARVRSPEYTEQLRLLRSELGLSMTINPERTAAMEILSLLRFPAALRRDTFAKGRVEIIVLKILPGSILEGMLLNEMVHVTKVRVLVCAVERGSEVIIPTGDFRLNTGDKIYVTAATSSLVELVRRLGIIEHKIRMVALIGGSRISQHLARELLADGVTVKIVEIDSARCKMLADMLPRAQIIHADGTQPEVFASENLARADALVTLTNIDEENMVLSMYGSHLGIPKVITKINRVEYDEVFRAMGIDSIVSPKNLVCSDIVRYVRAMQNTSENAVVTLHRIVNDKVEALEFLAGEDTRHLGVPLRDIRLFPGILIACINRGGQVIIPGGNDTINAGDTVIVVTTADRMYHNLNAIFA